jgi:hypothetical protein
LRNRLPDSERCLISSSPTDQTLGGDRRPTGLDDQGKAQRDSTPHRPSGMIHTHR